MISTNPVGHFLIIINLILILVGSNKCDLVQDPQTVHEGFGSKQDQP